MDGYQLFEAIRVHNFLSYGSDTESTTLLPLNVLIGPNASGKSNLLEAFSILQATATDLTGPLREGGGINEWIWKGGARDMVAQIEAIINYPDGIMPLRYHLNLASVGQRVELIDEAVENVAPNNPYDHDVYFFYRYQNGHPALNVRALGDQAGSGLNRTRRHLRREDLRPDQSVLSQRKDPDIYPEITYLAEQFSAITLFRDWSFGRDTDPRRPQPADLPADFLLPNGRNLGLVLNNLQHRSETRDVIIRYFRKFYESAVDVSTKIYGGSVQVYVHELGLKEPVPATRLSDGTLRFLCLLSILCHPSPPPFIGIEEPELGLHPDILPVVAELLLDASQRTQLVVTTHSDTLVTALSSVPEAILVCEPSPAGTRLRRLDPTQLALWLENYSLGELWRMGEIGGTR
ncbi:MAG: AAA family ATPase [Longimicrobiaceae bacterium]